MGRELQYLGWANRVYERGRAFLQPDLNVSLQIEHDRKARRGGYDHPYGQEEPKLEPIPAAVPLVEFRQQLLGAAVVLVIAEKRDVVLLSFPRRHG